MSAKCHALSFVIVLATGLTASAVEVRGVLIRVDPEKKEITLDGRGRGARGVPFTFTLAADCKVLFGSQPGEPADLDAGRRVRVHYEMQNGRPVAVVVHVFGVRPARAARVDPNAFTGTLQRVAVTDREVVVMGRGPRDGKDTETTFSVPANAPITRGPQPIKLEELKEGEQVAVIPAKNGGPPTAASIQVGTGGAEPRRGDRIERLRQILKTIDGILEEAQKQMGEMRKP
jgi:hypothetical protein